MPLLHRLSGALFNWISPNKTVQRREKPFKAPPPSYFTKPKSEARADVSGTTNYKRRPETPDGREIRWESASPSEVRPSTEVTPPRQISSRAPDTNQIWEPSSSSIRGDETSFIEDDSFDANEETKFIDIDKDDNAALEAATKTYILDLTAKVRKQKLKAAQMVADGWDPDSVNLYMMIARRAYEILMPMNWTDDFPLFPRNIFTDDYEDAFLRQMYGSEVAAKKQVEQMIGLGMRVRDSCRYHTTPARRPEGLIERAVKNYIKWANKDGKLARDVRKKRVLPLIHFATNRPGLDSNRLEDIMLQKLCRSSDRLLDLLLVEIPEVDESDDDTPGYYLHGDDAYICKPPTLYGIVSCQTVVALVAYEPLSDRGGLRTIAFFHFSKPHYDLWNSLALCMLVIYCRDHMLKIQSRIPAFEADTTESDGRDR